MIRRTRDTGCQEVVGDAALLVAVRGDTAAIAAALESLHRSPEPGSAIDAARERLIKRFDWDGVIAQHLTVYAQGSKGRLQLDGALGGRGTARS
jgi:glycosyltransferase involved in cell wall biosynthesis